ncbi:uncharacterized protein LY89DRAFT_689620 [Mollisia scopiformis]|uniref:Protein ROT1 n=1 Tax=Mollisia scopiformis TaxID=149040 RepID=A0A132BD94_MOLSC|nr:uncharacterized protein LY89DRAFT_689620 [Mollisia scopiformis]KUJ10341.1 hypothetical protein LY89DRAFT_689620 [Mollisia scopiformis]
MASFSLQSLLIAGACLASSATAINTQLVGTWSTKSAKVLTGPGFYNPVNDSFIEPSHTGISYSFTSDGYYEEAYYRAISNPTNPSCPQAIMQFQHGTFVENSDGSLSMSPFSVDGRQLQSNPCASSTSTYTRYNQSETFEKYQVYTDPYTKMTRLDLYQFDGSPMNPMFLAYSPPQMLPTVTMNPTATATASGKKAKRTAGLGDELEEPLNKNAMHIKREAFERPLLHRIDLNMLWWAGVGMTIFGGAAYLL